MSSTSDVGRAADRRRERLLDELVEERVPLPLDTPAGAPLLTELLYARHPPSHEGRRPRYGALLAAGPVDWSTAPGAGTVIECGDVGDDDIRRFADGRASFLLVDPHGPARLVCFEHTMEYEASAVELARATGAVVVQRGPSYVRVCGDDGVVLWDGVEWTFKPLAERHLAPLRRLVPRADPAVLRGALELCVHWLSAGRVGATIVWYLDETTRLGRVDRGRAGRGPALDVRRPSHYPALLARLRQLDRAVELGPDGTVRALGVALLPSEEALTLVPAIGGTRHTSARRFSFDEPAAIVFVVSEDGPVTVYADGAVAAQVRIDPCRSGFPTRLLDADPHPDDQRLLPCPTCARTLLVDVVDIPGWSGGPDRVACPVCGAVLEVAVYRAAVRGVRKGVVPPR